MFRKSTIVRIAESRGKNKRRAFTLIELLIVIAIIAVLAVVVVLVLNPAELLRQSRDANRLSDMATLNSALNLYNTDQSGASSFNLGNNSSLYLSVPDTSSNCANLGLPVIPSGYSYACASSTSSRNIDSSGWIPINLSALSTGSPVGSLPVDPINQTSSGLYYSYTTNGSQYELVSLMESQKYKGSVSGSLGPGVDIQGSSQVLSPAAEWTLSEGSGSTTFDVVGGNNGTWHGTPIGVNGGYYTSGKLSTYAADFDGSTDYVLVPNSVSLNPSQITITAWIQSPNWNNPSSTNGWKCPQTIVSHRRDGNFHAGSYDFEVQCNGKLSGELDAQSYGYLSAGGSSTLAVNQWYLAAMVFNGTNIILYKNASQDGVSATIPSDVISTNTYNFVSGYDSYAAPRQNPFVGFIADIRVYNRALSPLEIQAIYNAEK